MDFLSNFEDFLHYIMHKNNLAFKGLAEGSTVKLSSLYNYQSKLQFPSVVNAIKIADYFSLSLDYCFGLSEDNTEHEHHIADTITARVKQAIDASGMTRYKLAKLINSSENQFYMWYHGKQIPNMYSILCLAEALNCSADFLVGRDKLPQ